MAQTTEWSIEYEQCGLADLWVYKFDHEPIHDGAWHALNGKSKGTYRIVDERLQFVTPMEPIEPEQWASLLTTFTEIGFLSAESTVELVIRNIESGLSVGEPGGYIFVPIPSLSIEHLESAYEKLLDPEYLKQLGA